MEWMNPNPGEGFYLDPNRMTLPGQVPLAASNVAASTTVLPAEEPPKKIRKQYTITKPRESWTELEHDKFLQGLRLFGRDWKKIADFIGTKTIVQSRSHAQKYSLKVKKNGTNEQIPPPRSKKKATHPYPQKASKTAQVQSQVVGSFSPSSSLVESGYVPQPDSSSTLRTSFSNAELASWTNNSYNTIPTISYPQTNEGVNVVNNCCISSEITSWRTQPVCEPTDYGHDNQTFEAQAPSQAAGSFSPSSSLVEYGYVPQSDSSFTLRTSFSNVELASWSNNTFPTISFSQTNEGVNVVNNCSISSEITSWRTQPVCEPTDYGHDNQTFEVPPDFAEVYRFIGSVIHDPLNIAGHEQELKQMHPTDAATAVLLLSNLTKNLNSPAFEDLKRRISAYKMGLEMNNQCRSSRGRQEFQGRNIV